MNRRGLKLVTAAAAVSDADAAKPRPVTVIATTQPELWQPHFIDQLGNTLFVVDHAQAALDILLRHPGSIFLADYRALKDGWTGPRFAEELARHADSLGVRLWWLADRWTEQDEQLAAQCGAQGFVARTIDAVQAKAFGVPQPASAPDEARWKPAIDWMFRRFVGPMGVFMIKQTTERLQAAGPWSPQAYSDALASCVLNPARRAEFLQALREQGYL
ncbi:MAG: hypothetical protein EOP38_04110 [Rubrivivax sp.]|nr:MAG: hypothetical protein EOP38_04110 [Rubrivivax sp.]